MSMHAPARQHFLILLSRMVSPFSRSIIFLMQPAKHSEPGGARVDYGASGRIGTPGQAAVRVIPSAPGRRSGFAPACRSSVCCRTAPIYQPCSVKATGGAVHTVEVPALQHAHRCRLYHQKAATMDIRGNRRRRTGPAVAPLKPRRKLNPVERHL